MRGSGREWGRRAADRDEASERGKWPMMVCGKGRSGRPEPTAKGRQRPRVEGGMGVTGAGEKEEREKCERDVGRKRETGRVGGRLTGEKGQRKRRKD